MFKKICIFVLICLISVNSTIFMAYSKEENIDNTNSEESISSDIQSEFTDEDFELLREYEIIKDETFSKNKAITRIECLTGVLKAAGMRIDGFYDPDVRIGVSIEWDFRDSYYDGCEYAEYGYSYNIAYGVDLKTFNDGEFGLVFLPKKIATIEECIAFIMRCIEDVPKETSLDDIYQMAKDRGIIKETDEFYESGKANLSQEVFYTLLMRMLNEKRYIYFTNEFDNRPYSYKGKLLDEEGEMTYLEYAKSLYEDNEDNDNVNDNDIAS